jgi:hypothetical protein
MRKSFTCVIILFGVYILMKRPVRGLDGYYTIDGKKYKELFGSREQVFNGTAYKTEGLLIKKDLIQNKWRRIVSAKKHRTAKKERRLEKFGYFTQKGRFGFIKRTPKRSAKNRSKKNTV